MNEHFKKIFRYAFALLLVFVSVYLSLKGVNLDGLWKAIVDANSLWVIFPIPVIILSHWMRAFRWKTFLDPALKTKSASTWNLFSAVMIGYAVNCVLPRGGEFVRPFVYSRREKVSYSTTFATIIVERFIDLVTLFVIFAFAFLFFGEIVLKTLPSADPLYIAILFLLIVGVLIVTFYPPFFRYFLKALIKPFSEKYYQKLIEIYVKFQRGFAIIKTPSRYLKVSIESLLIWFFYTVPMYLMFFAFDFQQQYHLGFNAAIFLIIVSGVGVTIAPTPGAFGVYHFLIKVAMVQLYGISEEEALAYATVAHAINYFIQIGIGGIFILRENIRKIPQKEELTELNGDISDSPS